MDDTMLISPSLIKRFNHAAGLARAREFERSLKAWQSLLDTNRESPEYVTGDFLGQVLMRQAWVLMDLERYDEAREVFESDLLRACLSQFHPEVLYEYFFSYGNTLGQLSDLDAMNDALHLAIDIANDLGDAERVRRCRHNATEHARAVGVGHGPID